MARRRDYAAEYERRVRGTERGTWQRAVARGHAGMGDLERMVADRADDVEAVLTIDFQRNESGQIVRVDVLVIMSDGKQYLFGLRGRAALDADRLGFLVGQLPPGIPIGRAISYLLRESEYEAFLEEAE